MRITTTEKYRSFVQFRKSKKRFERLGFVCSSTDVTKTWSGMEILARYHKDDGTVEDISLI